MEDWTMPVRRKFLSWEKRTAKLDIDARQFASSHIE